MQKIMQQMVSQSLEIMSKELIEIQLALKNEEGVSTVLTTLLAWQSAKIDVCKNVI